MVAHTPSQPYGGTIGQMVRPRCTRDHATVILPPWPISKRTSPKHSPFHLTPHGMALVGLVV